MGHKDRRDLSVATEREKARKIVVLGAFRRPSHQDIDQLVRKHGGGSKRLKIMRIAGRGRALPFLKRKRIYLLFDSVDEPEGPPSADEVQHGASGLIEEPFPGDTE
jgi:hypothetical protein